MISDARNGHVSPGIYTEEKDVTYSVKSLGITSLGLVGETLYGPAFQNIEIKNWTEFVDYFGGTSTEKFNGGRPKYELPYIAKSYLEESNRLNVVRVLGLSGYHAGAAYVIKDTAENPIVILRSKMVYGGGNGKNYNFCEKPSETPTEVVSAITIGEYKETIYNQSCVKTGDDDKMDTISGNTYFKLVVKCKPGYGFEDEYTYNLTLDPSDNNYIYNVLNSGPNEGTTPVYIEAVYEKALSGSIATANTTVTAITSESITEITYFKIIDVEEKTNSGKSAKNGGNTISGGTPVNSGGTENGGNTISGGTPVNSGGTENSGSAVTYIYKIEKINATEDYSVAATIEGISADAKEFSSTDKYEIGTYIKTTNTGSKDIYDDYLECYRAAQTPWIVSEASVTINNKVGEAKMRKLFRFITISDGNAANYQVKVSIQNIKPEDGTFDVVVRDFNDNDVAPVILERFSKCNLVEGDANYIAHRIGTADGGYVSKSKFILVEMNDGDLRNSIPAGFLGYPVPDYGTNKIVNMKYNTRYSPEIKSKKQYFGISDLSGVDIDMLSYKGRAFYNDKYIGSGFHMDSALNDATSAKTYVDGVSGYSFISVSKDIVSNTSYIPRLINAPYIKETIYNDINLRKFTVCFYGGFDGWDVNRDTRSNTDQFKATKYNVNNSDVFKRWSSNNEFNAPLNLPHTAITSDYYAYLAGYRVFANPQDVDINLFATPGIDWANNTLLTEEAIDMIEDADDGRGGDALYIMTSPNETDVEELASIFADLDINSSYACTYAPWVMYYDSSNKRYLDLPVTKDVVRNMAATDNNSYPWFAPAGMERGSVNCIKAEYKTTLAQEDELYENRINPVKTFAQDGVKIWGNKTAYPVDSPLNRINVRRLMIRVKKLVTNAAKNLIFTQYDDTLEKQFRGLIDPILADVKSNRGISDYRIITEVTPETKDQHILPAKILIKPTPALEYISISFVVYPESVSFENE